jgi:hypothetical protein
VKTRAQKRVRIGAGDFFQQTYCLKRESGSSAGRKIHRTTHPKVCRSEGEVIRDRSETSGEPFREQAADYAARYLFGYGPEPLVPHDWLAIFQDRSAVRPDSRNLDLAGAPY